MPKRTKIIATLGPAVDDDGLLRDLIVEGVDVVRLNFSHGTHAEQKERMDRVKRIRAELGTPTAIMLDTCGPEIRTGLLEGGGPVHLRAGERLTLAEEYVPGTAERVSQTCKGLAAYVRPGTAILLDDGLIELEVEAVHGTDIVCLVKNDGELGQRKSLNVPDVVVPLPAFTEKDAEDLLFGIQQNIDYVAASFIRSAEGVRAVRQFLTDHGGGDIRIIAKIESGDAVEHVDGIIAEADGVMVARGDLGVEVPAWRVPHIQKRIIRACNRESKPVVVATQMLDSMIRNPRPTRAEVADVANALYDGTDAVMLSGETAAGAHPVKAVHVMRRIIEETERTFFDEHRPDRERTHARVSLAVGLAAVQTAETLDAACIVAPTMSGRTARLISNLRPKAPIYAVTPFPRVMRQMGLSWGVVPMLGDVRGTMSEVVATARDVVRERGLLHEGDIAVFTAGNRDTAPVEETASGLPGVAPTNVMHVVQVK